jgi:subtilisin family serine protease
VQFLESLPGTQMELWSAPEGAELELARQLARLPGVKWAGPNLLLHVTSLPDDPEYPQQWAHPQANAPAGWEITTGGSQIVIAVLDTGVDLEHPDLQGKLVPGRNFYNTEPTAHDKNGHGTHVAGIAAALTDNGVGIAGVSWGARIMPVRVTDSRGAAPTSVVVNGINWAVANGAKVINMSLGSDRPNAPLAEAVANAQAAGVLVVASSGNSAVVTPFYPASLPGVLSVGATGPDGSRTSYSNYGPTLDLLAPGGARTMEPSGILSTVPTYDVYLNTHPPFINQGYDYLAGTSMAAPYVSGLAAMLWSMNLDFSPLEVSQMITSTVKDLGSAGWDPQTGYGLIDAGAAAAAALASSGGDAQLAPIDNPNQQDEYTLRWSAVSGADAYELQQADNPDFEGAIVRYLGPDLQYRVTGQPPGTWYYRVRPDGLSLNVLWSATRITTVDASPLAAPDLNPVLNVDGNGDFALSWQAVAQATGYIVEESRDPYFSRPQVISTGDESAVQISGKGLGVWYYRVRATSPDGNGPWSETKVAVLHRLALPLIRR